MARIRTLDLGEILHKLPETESFDPTEDSTTQDDLFLCALGFESRGLYLPRLLSKSGYSARQGVFLKYDTNREDNEKNREDLVAHLNGIAKNVDELLVEDGQACTRHLKALLNALAKSAEEGIPKVTFDISVVANRAIMRCMKVLLETDIKLRIIYSEADIYYPTKEQCEANSAQFQSYDKVGLESGVGAVDISVVYPGHHLDPLPDCILLFPNFNADRSRSVISKVDHSLLENPRDNVIWLLGIPHLPEDRWRLDFMRDVNEIGDETVFYEVSTFHYKESLRLLDKLHSERWEQNSLTLAPIGSKFQALGSSLFCYLHPEVRVMLSAPKEYKASQYSEGCKATWLIDFGPTEKIRHLLNSAGTISIDENGGREKSIEVAN